MQLGEYYRGIPLNLVTRLPPDEVARRINTALPSPYRPFATGILGQVRRDRLRLVCRTGLFGYKGMPILTGPLELHPKGTLLRLVYRGRLGTRLAFPLGFLIVLAGLIPAFAIGGAAARIGPLEALLLALMLVLVVSLPLAIHVFFIRNAEAQLERMAAYLRSALDAKDAGVP